VNPTLKQKILERVRFDEDAVADRMHNQIMDQLREYLDDPQLQLVFDLVHESANVQHAKDQRIIVALAAQLENTVGALEKSQKALASGYSPQQDAGQQVYSEARHSVTQTLTDVRKFMEGLGHE